ncbi:MAG: hypothetical protein ACK42L_10120 [Thermoanaerobaculum sp.]
MLGIVPLLLLGVQAPVTVEFPRELVLEPLTVAELAGSAAVPWEGGNSPPLRPVVRRVVGAFRLGLPTGVSPASLRVEVQSGELKGGAQEGAGMAVQVTLLPLRLVQESPEGTVWEGDVLLFLDPTRAAAGEFRGNLTVTVTPR